TTPGYSGSRPPCGPCQNSSVSIRYCQYCTPTNDPKSRTAGPSGQPTVSVPPCRKRKSAPTKPFRTSRRRSSSNTSPTCNCSDCYEIVVEAVLLLVCRLLRTPFAWPATILGAQAAERLLYLTCRCRRPNDPDLLQFALFLANLGHLLGFGHRGLPCMY